MSSLWRRVCKGLFYVSFVVCEIGVLIGSSIIMSELRDYWWIGLLILLFGGFLVVVIHAFLGAVLEMMYNIAALRKKYYGIYEQEAEQRTDIKVARQDNEIKHIVSKVKVKEGEDSIYVPWLCPQCNQHNEAENQYCSNCGYDIDSQS